MISVAIDYWPAVTHAPGMGRYSRELVRALCALPSALDLRLFEVGGGQRLFRDEELGIADSQVRRFRSRLPRRLWRHALGWCGVEALLGPLDLFHRIQPDWPPLQKVRAVLPIAELPAAGTAAHGELARQAQAAALVVVFSAAYAERVARELALPAERVQQVPVGCDHWLRDLPADALEPVQPARILVLGALRAARRPREVLRAFELLYSGGCAAELCFAGAAGDEGLAFERELARSKAAKAVRWLGSPKEREMPALVASASVLVHLSADEGTPVTVLEACAHGLAVVATPLPALREALGQQAFWHPWEDTPALLAERLAEALVAAREPTARASRQALARPYTWAQNAAHTLALWSGLAQAGASC